jgi:CRP/FNR family cyclic AMP-dependent transcriptional regulator
MMKCNSEVDVADIIQRRSFKDGETVFREGELGSTAFLVQSGDVEISRMVDDNVKVLGIIGTNGIFGEMALIDEKPRMATAKVKGGAIIMTITKMMYERKLKSTDPFIRALLRILVQTVRQAQ